MTRFLRIKANTKKGYQLVREGGVFDISYPASKNRRGRVQGDFGTISPAITTQAAQSLLYVEFIKKIE